MSTSTEDRLAFLRERQSGIGGSDIGKILGYSPYGDALDVYHSKTRTIREKDLEPEGAGTPAERGRDLEPIAIRKYMAKTGRRGRRWPGYSDSDRPWAVAHIDWEAFSDPSTNPDGAEGTGVVEIKCPHLGRFGRVAEAGLQDHEVLQVQWYLAITGREWGGFGLYNPYSSVSYHSLTPDVTRDSELGLYLLDRMEAFWRGHVEPRIPPDPEEWAADDTQPDIPDYSGEYATVEEIEAIRKARELNEAIELKKRGESLYKDRKAALEEWVEAYAREHGTDRIRIPGVGKYLIIRSGGRERLSEDQLRDHRPIDRDAFVRWAMEQEDFWANYDGRRGMLVEELADRLALDIGRFVRQGEPSSYLRAYPVQEDDGDDADS